MADVYVDLDVTEYTGERERLFASMQSDHILCELLAEEGLAERLYEKRVAMGAGPGPYEGLLLEDHADYVVRCLVDDAVESFNRASKRSHIRCSGTLASPCQRASRRRGRCPGGSGLGQPQPGRTGPRCETRCMPWGSSRPADLKCRKCAGSGR